jgi:hypothetical protein
MVQILRSLKKVLMSLSGNGNLDLYASAPKQRGIPLNEGDYPMKFYGFWSNGSLVIDHIQGH